MKSGTALSVIKPCARKPIRFTDCRRWSAIVSCQKHDADQYPASAASSADVLVAVGIRALVALSAVNLTTLIHPSNAHARYVWKPRRHLRRMGDTRMVKLEQQVKEAEAREETRLLKKLGYSSETSTEVAEPGPWSKGADTFTSFWGGNQGYTVKLAADARQLQPVVQIPSRGPRGAIRVMDTGTRMPTLTTLGAVLLIGGILSAVGLSLTRLLGWRVQWGKAPEKGRWVSDRSLGGKLVFIPDAPRSVGSPAVLSWDTDANLDSVKDTDLSPEVVRALAEDAPPSRQPTGPPEWWSPPPAPSFPVSEATKQQCLREARSLLKGMEDAKLLRGTDYSLPALVELRRTCQEGSITARPKSDNVRDAMFRTAVGYATDTAREANGSLLGNCTLPEFVCGLAQDLGVPESKAVTIVTADVAAKCRSSLINALAAQLSGDTSQLFTELLGLASLLDSFPLAPGSAEVSMVGAATQQKASLECRQAVFFTFGAMTRERAQTVAEMLGFNHTLVMTELDKHLQGLVPDTFDDTENSDARQDE